MMNKIDYPYKASGLDNVILKDLTVMVDDSGEQCVRIPNIGGLHRELVRILIEKAEALSAKEIRFLRTEMGCTQAELAELVDRDAQTIGRWERGEHPIDRTADTIIRAAALDFLGLKKRPNIRELAMRSKVSAGNNDIVIDANDPNHYKQAA